ncbi:S9 family peptidase [Paenalkalicoccus suaedae]|uniref:S9 family peptidase n=1 Tax=Paenalkalicoccus suaedae TaxID=2592382 RepID=A0A859FJM3_9BACI|nr:S9 family peptidase [Paenalkalicoccus suaedae]QKS73004.1 S9 family peptidase [Paenalkalicoccus suaedae]
MITFPGHTLEQFFNTYTITNFTVAADESRILFSTNLNGKMNIWSMDGQGGYPSLFTQTEQDCSALKEDPEKRFVIGGFDHDGDENHHLYAMPYQGGKKQKLVEGEESDKFFFSQLNKHGNRMYYSTSQGNPSFLTGYRLDLESGEKTHLYDGEGGATTIAAVSPDEKWIVTQKLLANTYIKAELIHTDTGEKRDLSGNPEDVHVIGDAVFADDSTLYLLTNEQSEYDYVVKYDLATGERQPFFSLDKESVQHIHWHNEFNSLFATTEKGVEDSLYRVHTDGSHQKLDCPVKAIDQVSIAKSGNIYVLGTSATDPKNLYVHKDSTWTKLTRNQVPGVTESEMVDPDVVTYESYDGKQIEALWFEAKEENNNGHVIFWPHGGPQASERKTFRAMFQVILQEGYSIFAPNFRGSTGYGATFTKLVEGDWGEGPRLDCVAGIEWLFETGKCDRDRLFLMGGSYGGYMALLLHGRHTDYFRAVIDIFGVSNLFTFINSVPDHWKPVMARWVGDPEKDKDRLEKDSPITYLSTMTRPMLVIQGTNDPRVVKEESDQIVEALQKQGTDVDYMVLKDEGHGFSKKANEIRVYKEILGFLAKHRA